MSVKSGEDQKDNSFEWEPFRPMTMKGVITNLEELVDPNKKIKYKSAVPFYLDVFFCPSCGMPVMVKKPEFKSGRGRKYGSGRVPPSQIVGYINHLVEEKKISLDKAFFEAIGGLQYEYDYIKEKYYDTIKREMPYFKIDPSENIHDLDGFKNVIRRAFSEGRIFSIEFIVEHAKKHKWDIKEIIIIYIEEAKTLLGKTGLPSLEDWLKENLKIGRHYMDMGR